MRNYHSPDPIILSVGEEDEVPIADVAKHIAGKHTEVFLHCYLVIAYLSTSCDEL